MEPTEDAAGEDEARSGPTSRTRWRLGVLTLLVLVAIAGGFLLLGSDDGSGFSTTIPELQGAFGLPTQNGEAAPDFSLTLLDGSRFRLTEHLSTDGRPVILNLWASWCGPCRAEMPAFDIASKIHTDVYFLGVAVEDDRVAAEEFAAEIDVSYSLAIDEADRVGRRYPTPGLPATYLISADGAIVRTVFGQVDETQITDLITESFGL